jgi:predicted DNA-binding transcriptional regulator AlpA
MIRSCCFSNPGHGEKDSIMRNNGEDRGEMLTATEVREITGVPVSTLHDWAAKRERGIAASGPHHVRLSGRHRRWMRADVSAWLESARV